MVSMGLNLAYLAEVHVPAPGVMLDGDLCVPAEPRGAVIFAHGSGSSRQSARIHTMAEALHRHSLATLIMDLLTFKEEQSERMSGHLRFDIKLLARRLAAAIDWISQQPRARELGIGLLGASTGGGAALVASVLRASRVQAVASRGGRPDLAGPVLPQVTAPTLLIVAGNDPQVLSINQRAAGRLNCVKRLQIVAGASHLFDEPGTLNTAGELAADWFVGHLSPLPFMGVGRFAPQCLP